MAGDPGPGGSLGWQTKTLVAIRVVAGTALLLAPGRVLRDLPHEEIEPAATVFARILGARHLIEAALLLRGGSGRRLRIGAGVDAVHGATMICLGAVRPDERRLALTNAMTAAALAGAGMWVARADRC